MDAIVALATFPSRTSALNIIRLTGDKGREIISRIFPCPSAKPLEHHVIRYGNIVDPSDNRKIDDIILLPYFAPNSFTGEDLFEIICHGGEIIHKQIVSLIVSEGARIAESGEFTKRAYQNNKIDLSQAEAIHDIICSENDVALELARKNLDGVLGNRIDEIRGNFIAFLTELETSINFPEDEVVSVSPEKLETLSGSLRSLLENAAFSEDLNIEDVLILGEPNVGKSSLLNKLSGLEKSIVTDISGTTRDLIEHHIDISGIKVNLVDTAGINRASSDLIEGIGIQKALDKIRTARTILYLIDATMPFDKEAFLGFYRQHLQDFPTGIIFAINKTDIAEGPDLSFLKERHQVVSISAKEGHGLDILRNSILSSIDNYSEELLGKSFFINVRQRELLQRSLAFVSEAQEALANGATEEIIADLVRCSLLSLERIIGRISDEELLDSIFSNFCIGK